MSEKISPLVKFEQKGLKDASQRVRAELATFTNRSGRDLAAPRGLFVRLAGQTVRAETIVDHGCHGGRTEYYDVELSDEPLEIKTVQTSYDAKAINLSLKVPGHYTSPAKLMVDELDHIEFLEKPETPDNEFDEIIKQSLSTNSFITTPSDQLTPDWQHAVKVRARSPLAQPISVHRSRREPARYPLEGIFERVDSYFDTRRNQNMARVIIFPDEMLRDESTDWVPLDALEFDLVEVDKKQALAFQLFKTAQKLIAGQISHESLNNLLKNAETKVTYPLPYDRRLSYASYPARAEFVLGRVAARQVIRDLSVPTLRNHNGLEKPYVRADYVTTLDKQPWLVDETAQVATPLLSPIFKTRHLAFDKPIEDWTTQAS